MEVKKNLNGTQRKMLDEIYSIQFEKRANIIREQRKAGLDKLTTQSLRKFSGNKDIKKLLELGKQYYELSQKLGNDFSDNGVQLTQTLNSVPHIEIRGRYYGSGYGQFPEVEAYSKETQDIELELGEKKREMRAKIYGVAASYEEVDSDIKSLLATV